MNEKIKTAIKFISSISDNIKIALIAAATVIICVCLWIYFSPYQSCMRENGNPITCLNGYRSGS